MQPRGNRKQVERMDNLVDTMRKRDELWNIDEIPTLLQSGRTPTHINSISKNTIIILSMAFTASVVAAIIHFTLPATTNNNHPISKAGFVDVDAPAMREHITNNSEKDTKTATTALYTKVVASDKAEIAENKALNLNPQELNYLDVKLKNDGIWFQTLMGTMVYNQGGMICVPGQAEPGASPMVVAMSDNMVNPAYTIPFERGIKANDGFIPVKVSNHEGTIDYSAIFWYRPDDFYQSFPASLKTDIESKKPTTCGLPKPGGAFSNHEIYKILYPQQELNTPNTVYDTVKPKNIKPVDWGKIDKQMKAIDSQLRIVNEQLKKEGKVYNQHMREYQLKMDSFSRKINQMQPYMNRRFKSWMKDTNMEFYGSFPNMKFKWSGDSFFKNNGMIIFHDGNEVNVEMPEMPELPQMPNICIPPIPDIKNVEPGYRYYYYYDLKKNKFRKKKIKQHGKKSDLIEQDINIKY